MYGNRSLLFILRKYYHFCYSTRLHETSQLFVPGYFQQVKGISFLAEKLSKLKSEPHSQHDNMMYFESKMDELQENLQYMAHSKSKMEEWQENLQHLMYSESKLEDWREDLHMTHSESKFDELQEDLQHMAHFESEVVKLQEDLQHMTHSESKVDESQEDLQHMAHSESEADKLQEDLQHMTHSESKVDELQEDLQHMAHSESKVDESQEDMTHAESNELQGDLQHLTSFIDFLMVKRFLKLEVDENGKKIPVNANSPDYYLFKSSIPDKLNVDFMTKELKEDFMTKHYHKYPFIHINFNCEETPINCMHDALSFCRSIIHECYEDCIYLINSDSLSEEEKELCGKWCDENQYYNFNEDDVCQSFKQLSSYLQRHHKCRVIFLVEDVNSMATEAKFNVIDIKEAQDVINLNEIMVNSMKVEKNENVLYEFMTEILYPGAVRILDGVNFDT